MEGRDSMASILVDLFRHNVWANLRLLDACAPLASDHLDANAPGTFGTVRDTLVHLLAAEGRYLAALTGEAATDPLSERDPFPGMDALRARAHHNGDGLIAEAARARSSRVIRGVRGGHPFAIPAAVFLIQAINHATEHRSQIKTILTQHGVEPPDLDGWAYDAASRHA